MKQQFCLETEKRGHSSRTLRDPRAVAIREEKIEFLGDNKITVIGGTECGSCTEKSINYREEESLLDLKLDREEEETHVPLVRQAETDFIDQ